MCCLFGLIDYGHNFTGGQKARMLSVLAAECEVRGTDATGIAYNSGGGLHIYKRPLSAHKMKFHIPTHSAQVITGHTRMATQGKPNQNYNNHPFKGMAGGMPFALAHNGVIRNDRSLRRVLKLPTTDIQTDSYIAVQLLEEKGMLNFDSLRFMAEQLEGSFTFTLLDAMDNFYIVKGDNPLCLYHFPATGLYLYASMEEILRNALKRIQEPMDLMGYNQVKLSCGDLLRIGPNGAIFSSSFDATNLCWNWWPLICVGGPSVAGGASGRAPEIEYCDALKTVARAYGFSPEDIDKLTAQGFSPEEIEAYLWER